MINKWLILVLCLISICVTGCANGFAFGNVSGTPVRNITVSWDDFQMHDSVWGGGGRVIRVPFPEQLTFEWEDRETKTMKRTELEVPKSATGYPRGGLKMLIHSNGVIEVMHSWKGKKIGDHGYKRKITDQW
jgi:hypothetical protein